MPLIENGRIGEDAWSFIPDGEPVPNALRLETYGSPFVGWVRVTVDPDSPGVFIVEPRLVAIAP